MYLKVTDISIDGSYKTFWRKKVKKFFQRKRKRKMKHKRINLTESTNNTYTQWKVGLKTKARQLKPDAATEVEDNHVMTCALVLAPKDANLWATTNPNVRGGCSFAQI